MNNIQKKYCVILKELIEIKKMFENTINSVKQNQKYVHNQEQLQQLIKNKKISTISNNNNNNNNNKYTNKNNINQFDEPTEDIFSEMNNQISTKHKFVKQKTKELELNQKRRKSKNEDLLKNENRHQEFMINPINIENDIFIDDIQDFDEIANNVGNIRLQYRNSNHSNHLVTANDYNMNINNYNKKDQRKISSQSSHNNKHKQSDIESNKRNSIMNKKRSGIQEINDSFESNLSFVNEKTQADRKTELSTSQKKINIANQLKKMLVFNANTKINTQSLEKQKTIGSIDKQSNRDSVQTTQLNNSMDEDLNVKHIGRHLFSKDKSQYDKVQNQQLDHQQEMFIITDTKENIKFSNDASIYIPDDSAFSYFWNLLITLILCFQIIAIPFERLSEPWLENDHNYIVVNIFLEYMIILDIVVNFFTSQVDQQGKNVRNINLIAKHQLQTWFLIDIFSSIPTNNLQYFNIIAVNNFNVFLRMLKLPKYFRVLKGFMKLLESRFSNMLDINTVSETERRMINSSRQLVSLLMLSHTMSCLLISQSQYCDPDAECVNWFSSLMGTEFQTALRDDRNPIHNQANSIQDNYPNEDIAIIHFQNQVLGNRRLMLYCDAWQFVIQTVTTVGQGDVATFSYQERLFRSACMVIGVINFSLLSANFMEQIISESINIQRNNKHLIMIEKLVQKQKVKGEARRFLQLLGDSVQTEAAQREVDFVKLLPRQMSNTVLLFIQNEQTSRISMLHEESIDFFKLFMLVSNFRRCITEELIGNDRAYMSIVYSGQIGVKVSNVSVYLREEFLDYIGMGEEIGYNNLIEMHTLQSYSCVLNSELVEIKNQDFLDLVISSFKGIWWAYGKLLEQLMDVQMVTGLQQTMMKMGHYFDQKWYNQVLARFNFDIGDFKILDKLQKNYTQNIISERKKRQLQKLDPNGDRKWYSSFLDPELHKLIMIKCRQIARQIVNEKQENFVEFARFNVSKSLKI